MAVEQPNVVFPGILSSKERVNLDALRSDNPQRFLYFEVLGNNQNKTHVIGTVPKTGLIYGFIFIRVVEEFDGVLPTLVIGTAADRSSIGETPLSSAGARQFYGEGFDDFGREFTADTDIRVSMIVDSGTITTGRAMGVVSYLVLDKLPSFRKTIGLS